MPKHQPKNTQISVTLWASLIARCDALVAPMAEDIQAHGGVAGRTSVLRTAIYEGIKVLEARYLPDRPPVDDEDDSNHDSGDEDED